MAMPAAAVRSARRAQAHYVDLVGDFADELGPIAIHLRSEFGSIPSQRIDLRRMAWAVSAVALIATATAASAMVSLQSSLARWNIALNAGCS